MDASKPVRLGMAAFAFAAALLAASCEEPPPPIPPPSPESLVPDPPFDPVQRLDTKALKGKVRLVLFIVIDTLRADYVGAYGSDRGLTPNLDNLAESGFLFEQAIATSSWTRSSIASMFTSCFSGAIGVETREDVLSDDLLTLAEILKTQGGFHTVAVSSNGNAGREVGFAQGFDSFHDATLTRGYPGGFKKPIAEGVSLDALHYIRFWQEGDYKKKPMFLFVHYVDPHDPYLPHPEIMDGPEPPGRFDGSRAQLREMDALPVAELTDADKARIDHLYSGEVKYCDRYVGELLNAIMSLDPKLLEKSLIIATADHGEGLWAHDYRAHGSDLYREQTHVPLILRLPGMVPGDGKRIATPVSLLDLAPTVLSFCGIASPAQYQGRDLMPLLHGMDFEEPCHYIYSELFIDGQDFESILKEGKKVIRNRALPPHLTESFELYDWGRDPLELQDLSRSGEPVEWSKTMKTALKKWGDAVQSSRSESERIDLESLDEETINNLKALGYIGGETGPPSSSEKP